MCLGQTCVLTINVCAPHPYGWWEDCVRKVGVPVGVEVLGGVGVVGWLEGLHWSVGDTWSRWSHMWGSWYFLRFLLRVGSCTWIKMASLMVLEWLLTSLCTMLNCSGSIGWPVVVLCKCMGKGLWNVLWLFHPVIFLIHLCKHWGNLFVGIASDIWYQFGCFWGPCPWGFLVLSLVCWFP